MILASILLQPPRNAVANFVPGNLGLFRRNPWQPLAEPRLKNTDLNGRLMTRSGYLMSVSPTSPEMESILRFLVAYSELRGELLYCVVNCTLNCSCTELHIVNCMVNCSIVFVYSAYSELHCM